MTDRNDLVADGQEKNSGKEVYACIKNTAEAPFIYSDYQLNKKQTRVYGGPNYTFGLGTYVPASRLKSSGTGILFKIKAPAGGGVVAVMHSVRVRFHYFKNLKFVPLSFVLPSVYPTGLAAVTVSPNTGTQIAVGRYGKILRSTDNGVTWTSIALGYSFDLLAVTFRTIGSGFTAAGQSGAVFNSDDDGLTWVKISTPTNANLYSIRPGRRGGFVMAGAERAGLRASHRFTDWVIRDIDDTQKFRGFPTPTVSKPLASIVEITGLVPVHVEAPIVDVPVGGIRMKGLAPVAGLPIPVVSMSITGLAPIVNLLPVPVPVVSMIITGLAPVVELAILVPAGNIIMTGIIPVVVSSG